MKWIVLTAAERLFFIQVQVKPESHSVHLALCYHIQLHNVVAPSALALPLKEVLKHLAGLGEAGMGQLVKLAGFITLVPPARVADRINSNPIYICNVTEQYAHLQDGKAGAEAMHMCMTKCDTEWLPFNTLLPAVICYSNAIQVCATACEHILACESAASPLSDGDDMLYIYRYMNIRICCMNK